MSEACTADDGTMGYELVVKLETPRHFLSAKDPQEGVPTGTRNESRPLVTRKQGFLVKGVPRRGPVEAF